MDHDPKFIPAVQVQVASIPVQGTIVTGKASSQARLAYLDGRRAGLSRLQAGELADKELYPEPEISEEEDEDQVV